MHATGATLFAINGDDPGIVSAEGSGLVLCRIGVALTVPPCRGVHSILLCAAGFAGVDPMVSNAGEAESWSASLKLCLGAVEGITEGLDEGGTKSSPGRGREKAMAGWDCAADTSRYRLCMGVAFT